MEAGASVRCNAKLVDMNVAVHANDERAVEVLASGLPLFHGAQLAVDITPPRPGAAAVDGIVCAGARAHKELKYSELFSGDRCRLVVVAMETGGRWSPEAVEFVENLTAARARDAPPTLQRSTFLGWRRRWSRMLSISCGRSFANSLVAQSSVPHALAGIDGSGDLPSIFFLKKTTHIHTHRPTHTHTHSPTPPPPPTHRPTHPDPTHTPQPNPTQPTHQPNPHTNPTHTHQPSVCFCFPMCLFG